MMILLIMVTVEMAMTEEDGGVVAVLGLPSIGRRTLPRQAQKARRMVKS